MHCPVAISSQASLSSLFFAHAPADKAAMDAIATPAPQPRHRTCDEPEANKRKSIEKLAHWQVERGQIMLHEVVPVLMEKFGATCVTGAEMDSIDMYAEVHLRSHGRCRGPSRYESACLQYVLKQTNQ